MGDKIQEKQGNDYNKSKECDYLWEERERERGLGVGRNTQEDFKVLAMWQCSTP